MTLTRGQENTFWKTHQIPPHLGLENYFKFLLELKLLCKAKGRPSFAYSSYKVILKNDFRLFTKNFIHFTLWFPKYFKSYHSYRTFWPPNVILPGHIIQSSTIINKNRDWIVPKVSNEYTKLYSVLSHFQDKLFKKNVVGIKKKEWDKKNGKTS